MAWPGPGGLGGHAQSGMTNLDIAKQHPGKAFEMPDGWNQMFPAVDRYRAIEGVFDAKMALSDAANPAPTPAQTIGKLVEQSIANVDVDLKPHLLANVVVTGGSSLFPGFNDRLNMELQMAFSGLRVKMHSPGNLAERRFGSWIGGSILASLGTFHQMWISRKEFEEHGAGIIEKRCK